MASTPEQEAARDIEAGVYHPYYGPKHRQAIDFVDIATRNKMLACDTFAMAKAAGATITDLGNRVGVRFQDGTGFLVHKADIEASAPLAPQPDRTVTRPMIAEAFIAPQWSAVPYTLLEGDQGCKVFDVVIVKTKAGDHYYLLPYVFTTDPEGVRIPVQRYVAEDILEKVRRRGDIDPRHWVPIFDWQLEQMKN